MKMHKTRENNQLTSLKFEPSFFNDEIREGFYISGMMKRYWAGQIKVLSEIVKICEKYDIQWFADYGTLIGAVRHGGYIPWDDDLDICMLRDDYEKFMTVADRELPEGYVVLTLENEPEYEMMLGRVVNSKTIDYSDDRLSKFYGCPYTIGVDIFPLDALSKDIYKEEERILFCKELTIALKMISEGKNNTPEAKKCLSNIERHNNISFHGNIVTKHDLLLLMEKLYKKFPMREADEVVLAPFWIKNKNHRFPKKLFESFVSLPFENTYVAVSSLYEKMLQIEYGNYMTIYRAGGIHEYPVYRDQEKTMRDHIKHNPFRYTFSSDIFKEQMAFQTKHERVDFTKYCMDVVGLMQLSAKQMKDLFASEAYVEVYQLLEGCQSMAISLGTEIEKRVNDCSDIVGLLEKYCETIYICHEKLAEGILKDKELYEIEKEVFDIEKVLKTILKHRKKQVLFFPCNSEWWDSMKNIYMEKISDVSNECIVLPIPCYQKKLDGEIIGILENSNQYQMDVNVEAWQKFDLDSNYYDEIIIQFPFDGWNRSMTIPPQFYSENLIKHTDSLVYTPCFVPEFPEQHDAKLYEALKTLVEQPAVVYSDKIVLHSEKERWTYMFIAEELTCNEYTEYWNEKFEVLPNGEEEVHDHLKYINREEQMRKIGLPGKFQDGKVLLFHIGISSLVQYRDQAMERLKETIIDITDNGDSIKCIFSSNPNLIELERIDSELWGEYRFLIEGLHKMDNIYVDEKMDPLRFIDIVDGYYGDADEVAHRCRNKGIPVMIRKADLFD